MKCEITWSTQKPERWDDDFAALPHTTLLQSYAYARAIAHTTTQRPHFGIITIDNQKAGLVQTSEARLLGTLVHALILDRGPLWFENFGADAHFNAFCKTLNTQFPARIGRKRRFIPEHADTQDTRAILKENGFTQSAHNTYQTQLLDLCPTQDTLKKALKKSWRASLKTAEKSDLTIEWDDQGALYNEFVTLYLKDKIEKNYDGTSHQLLNAMAQSFIPTGDFIIGQALAEDGQTAAAILIITHGKSATYQIGMSLPKGRKTCANHLLLWNAIPMLQQKGITTLDLGGFNDHQASGIKKFKEGMGGTYHTLPGLHH